MIREDWKEYYEFLESLRVSGVVNMFGAGPYLAREFKLDKKVAREILGNWMQNYNKLSDMYGWNK